MPVRGRLARVLLWSGALGVGALAVVGGLSLRASGLVAVGLAGMLAACAAAGIARESSRSDRRSMIEAAVQAAGCAVGGLLVLAGIATVAGAVAAVLVGGAALAGWLVRLVLRDRSSGPGAAAPSVPPSSTGEPVAGLPARPPDLPDRTVSVSGALPAPVWTLTTPALGQEWLFTTAALAGRRAGAPGPGRLRAVAGRRPCAGERPVRLRARRPGPRRARCGYRRRLSGNDRGRTAPPNCGRCARQERLRTFRA